MSMWETVRRELKGFQDICHQEVSRKDRFCSYQGYVKQPLCYLDSELMSEHPLDGSKDALEEMNGRDGPSYGAQRVPDWESSMQPPGAWNQHDVVGVVPISHDVQYSPAERMPVVPDRTAAGGEVPLGPRLSSSSILSLGGSTKSAFQPHGGRHEAEFCADGSRAAVLSAVGRDMEGGRCVSTSGKGGIVCPNKSAKAAWMSRYRDECDLNQEKAVEVAHELTEKRNGDEGTAQRRSPVQVPCTQDATPTEREREWERAKSAKGPSPCMEWAKESVRQTMLHHQRQFSEQVKELHRIVSVQRQLMESSICSMSKASADRARMASGCAPADNKAGGVECLSANVGEKHTVPEASLRPYQNLGDVRHAYSVQDTARVETIAAQNERERCTSSTSEVEMAAGGESGRRAECWRANSTRPETGYVRGFAHELSFPPRVKDTRNAGEEEIAAERVVKKGNNVHEQVCGREHTGVCVGGVARRNGVLRKRGHQDEVVQTPDRLRGGHANAHARVNKAGGERAEGWGEVRIAKEKRKRDVGGLAAGVKRGAEACAEALMGREKRGREESWLSRGEKSDGLSFEAHAAKGRDSRGELPSPLPVVSKPRRFGFMDTVKPNVNEGCRPLNNNAHGRNGCEVEEMGKESAVHGGYWGGGVSEAALRGAEFTNEAEACAGSNAPRCASKTTIPSYPQPQVGSSGVGHGMPSAGNMLGGFPMGEGMQCGYGGGAYDMQAAGYGVGMGMMMGPGPGPPGYGAGSMMMAGIMGAHANAMNMAPHFVGSGMDGGLMWYGAGYPLQFQQYLQQYPALQGAGAGHGQSSNHGWPASVQGCMLGGGGMYPGGTVGMGSQPQNQMGFGGQQGVPTQQQMPVPIPVEPIASEEVAVKRGRQGTDEGVGVASTGWNGSGSGSGGPAGATVGTQGPTAGGSGQVPSFPPVSIVPPPRPPFKRPPPLVLLRDGTTMHLKPLPAEERGRKPLGHASAGRMRSVSEDEKDGEEVVARSGVKAFKGGHAQGAAMWLARHKEGTSTSPGGPAASTSGGGRAHSRARHAGERMRVGTVERPRGSMEPEWLASHRTLVAGPQEVGPENVPHDAGAGFVGETGDDDCGNDSVSSDNGAVFHPQKIYHSGDERGLAEGSGRVSEGDEWESKIRRRLAEEKRAGHESDGSGGVRGTEGEIGFSNWTSPPGSDRTVRARQDAGLPPRETSASGENTPSSDNPSGQGQGHLSDDREQQHSHFLHRKDGGNVQGPHAEVEECDLMSSKGRQLPATTLQAIQETRVKDSTGTKTTGCESRGRVNAEMPLTSAQGRSTFRTAKPGCGDKFQGIAERRQEEECSPTPAVVGSAHRDEVVGGDSGECEGGAGQNGVGNYGEKRKRSSLDFLESAVLMLKEAEGRGEWTSHAGHGLENEAPKEKKGAYLRNGGDDGRVGNGGEYGGLQPNSRTDEPHIAACPAGDVSKRDVTLVSGDRRSENPDLKLTVSSCVDDGSFELGPRMAEDAGGLLSEMEES